MGLYVGTLHAATCLTLTRWEASTHLTRVL